MNDELTRELARLEQLLQESQAAIDVHTASIQVLEAARVVAETHRKAADEKYDELQACRERCDQLRKENEQ